MEGVKFKGDDSSVRRSSFVLEMRVFMGFSGTKGPVLGRNIDSEGRDLIDKEGRTGSGFRIIR